VRIVTLAATLCAAWIALPAVALGQIDPSGSWQTWHTEHFRIHARSSHASQALRAGREAERAYEALSKELVPPKGRIDLVLNDAADFSNGNATVFPSNRITVNLAPPATANSLGFYDEWFRLVTTHELTHIFHLDRSTGIWNVLQKVFGRAPGLFPNTYQPGWVAEGIATYYESRFTRAGRIRSAYHARLLGSAARDGAWPRSGDAVMVNPVWPAGKRPYAWGGRYFEQQRVIYGDSIVPRFIERTSRQLIVFNVSSPMKSAGGESVGDGWRRLEHPAATARGDYRVLERGLRTEPKARVSPDGTRICFKRLDGRNPEQLVVRDLNTGDDIATRRVNSVGGVAWVGDTLYVTQLDFSSPFTIRSDLYRWVLGEQWERVSEGGRHIDVFSTPDGRVGLVSLRPGERTIGAMHYPDSSISEFSAPDGALDWGRVVVSPNGEWVAAARHADQQWDIVMWPMGRPESFSKVTDDVAMDADPAWSIDGGSVLFSSERSGLPQVYAYDITSRRTRRLTDEPTGARFPEPIGPDSLIFSTVLGDGYALVQTRVQSYDSAARNKSFDSLPTIRVPDVTVRAGSYSPWPALRPHFWVPVGHDEDRSGAFIGMMTIGVDPIGRTSYSALVTAAPENGRVEGVVYVSHRRWRSWSLDLAAAQTWDYDPFLYEGAVVPASFKEQAAEVGVVHRWRRWRTEAAFRLRGFLERDVVVNEGDGELPFIPLNPTYAGGAVTASVSYASRPSLSISPENGVALESMLLRRWHTGGSQYWSYEARGRVSGFLALPLPGFAHWVLAASVSAGKTGGTAPTTFSVGGESGDLVALVPGAVLGSGRRRFQMRGYDGRSGFTRAVVGVVELRVPVALVARGVPRLPLFLDRLSLNIFGEVGSGWTERYTADLTAMRDVGGEVAIDLGVGAGIPLRMRLGGAVALTDWLDTARGSGRYYVAFGRAF